ncbi:MAG: HIRAN domain-containing protein [Sphingomonas sp.]
MGFDEGARYFAGMDERELSLAVVGITHPNADKARSNRRFELALCVPGEPIELRAEPKNPHDAHAVAVFSVRGTQLGYLTAERAPWIGGKIKAGEDYQAIFQEAGATSAVIRLRFGGGAPALPPRRDPPGPPDDFEPDPDGPEWGA